MIQNESHAEIVKRMQNFARQNNSWPCSEDIKTFAVKLDAANRREVTEAATKAATSAVNLTKEKYTRLLAETAKLRDALDAVVKVGYPHNFQREAPHIRGYCYDITRAIEKCFDALANLETTTPPKGNK